MKSVVDLQMVSHQFGKKIVLSNITLSINKGEIFGLLGPSGSGKTTVVKLITGLLKPSDGSVYINGEKMPSLAQMKRYGFMAQSDALYLELTGKENLDFFASIYRLNKQEKKQRIRKVMEMVDLTDHIDQIVETYSGGMKRRLSLAAALLHDPELIILDEPTVGIDPVLRKSIWDELRQLKDKGVTIILTTHVMDEAEKCDRLAMLREGQVIAMNTPEKLKSDCHATTIEDVFLHYGGAAQ
ncbi:ABC transporter ATP-binding protein [Halobacillus andaensis]|uniref:ABC transporter ATP-binding protein n=1 Tax=Halobacillus andaensis TaxID=1176239 RepID=A0A917B3X5_HALAA|nr:ABC transporter ATP-binding protein [Halobacillus andaensis]MBP2004648.1 ABC-2 type transport system ATP-binding protein [Halobacillus andaensis]GGF20035.1 ABC transporter ATP-binding protein [Halobacillus andaensis]